MSEQAQQTKPRIDLATKAGALEFAAIQRDIVAGNWKIDGCYDANGFSFGCHLFMTHQPEYRGHGVLATGEQMPHVTADMMRLPPELAFLAQHSRPEFLKLKEIYNRALRQFAKASKAIGSLLVSEMWTVEAPQSKHGDDPAAFRATLPDDLKDAPGRGECLLMILEHRETGRIVWRAKIERNPDRLLPWKQWDDWHCEGGFVDLTDWKGDANPTA